MRRVVLALTGMVAGTTLLISLKSAPGASRTPQQVAADAARFAALEASATAHPQPPGPLPTGPPPPPDPRSTPAPGTTTNGAVKPTNAATKPGATSKPGNPTKPQNPNGGQITGDSVFTEFGYVTVAIKVTGGKITDVIAVELPGDEPRSISLSQKAAPILRQRALAAQSAEFDSVSGATWTSDAYRTSLQSALDKAGLA